MITKWIDIAKNRKNKLLMLLNVLANENIFVWCSAVYVYERLVCAFFNKLVTSLSIILFPVPLQIWLKAHFKLNWFSFFFSFFLQKSYCYAWLMVWCHFFLQMCHLKLGYHWHTMFWHIDRFFVIINVTYVKDNSVVVAVNIKDLSKSRQIQKHSQAVFRSFTRLK